MYLQLDDSDRIVVEYYAPPTEGTPKGQRIVVACGEEVLDTDIYMVLWELRNGEAANKWQLMWRGNWKTAMDQFSELVGDIDHDYMVEKQADALAKVCKVCGNKVDHLVHSDNEEGWHAFEPQRVGI